MSYRPNRMQMNSKNREKNRKQGPKKLDATSSRKPKAKRGGWSGKVQALTGRHVAGNLTAASRRQRRPVWGSGGGGTGARHGASWGGL